MTAAPTNFRKLGAQGFAIALALGIWFAPVPAGLTKEAWHLFAVFAAAIFSVIVNAFPLVTASLLAVAVVVLTRTVDPVKAFAGFANQSVLLVVVAFLVANAVVKCGLGRRISLLVVSMFGRSTLGLGYSIIFTDALIAPAFPSNTARGGVLYPIILSLAQSGGSTPEDPERRRLGGYLMFCGMVSLSVSSGLWLTATSANPIGVSLAAQHGVTINFGSWLLASSVPALATILLLPLVLIKLFPPGVSGTPDAPALARKELKSMGPLTRDEWIVAVTFAVMVTGWVMADTLRLSLAAVAFGGLGVLLATNVLTPEDLSLQGGTLVTFLWLAVLFALSGQLNELGFMGYVGGRLTALLGGIAWPIVYVVLLLLYVLMHYMFVSQSAQVLALFAVFLDVGVGAGVPAFLMAFQLLFASSYFSSLTPQGGSQNVIFVGSNYLTQGELYRLGILTTGFCLIMFLILGTPWLLSSQVERLMSDQQRAVIQALLDYYEAFNTSDVQAILPSFHEPALLIAPSGAFAAPTHDVLAPVLKALIHSLRQTGWGRSELRVGRVESLSAGTSVANGTAIRYRPEGPVLERVGVTYVLQNADGRWRIAVVITHDAPSKETQ